MSWKETGQNCGLQLYGRETCKSLADMPKISKKSAEDVVWLLLAYSKMLEERG